MMLLSMMVARYPHLTSLLRPLNLLVFLALDLQAVAHDVLMLASGDSARGPCLLVGNGYAGILTYVVSVIRS